MKLVRLNAVMECTGLARSTVYKFIAEGHFPKPVKLSARMVAWVEAEVQEWILARIGERDNTEYQNVN